MNEMSPMGRKEFRDEISKITYDKYRELNIQNPNQRQDVYPRVLCVCLGGMMRSPTIAHVLNNWPYDCNARACGTESLYSPVVLDRFLLEWADVIVCADDSHLRHLYQVFPSETAGKPIYSLGIPDHYQYRDPKLVRLIKQQLETVGFPYGLTTTKISDHIGVAKPRRRP